MRSKMKQIFSLDQKYADSLVEQQYLTRQRHQSLPLLIYCYTQKCLFEQFWNPTTRHCRGLVTTLGGEIVSKPFERFFNLGEPSAPHPPKKCDYLAFEKLDGSLLNIANYNGEWICTTKASFNNPYTEFAYTQLDRCLTDYLAKDVTLMTEVVLSAEEDDMRRAVVHEPGLYFLGATHTPTRKDLNPTMFYGSWNGFFPQLYKNSVDELLQQSNEIEGTEGWVVRYSNGLRLKIKTVWYLKLFRLISKLDTTVKLRILTGDTLDDLLVDVPEELQEEVQNIYNEIYTKVDHRYTLIKDRFNLIGKCKDRKTFAQRVQNESDKSYLFKLLDGKDIKQDLLQAAVNGAI